MDIERIIHSDIPDIVQVYGGVRGRAMTAKYQGREWPMLLESGLKTVIDLRYEDQTKRLAVICEELGVNYFHYPVGRHGESASLMIEKFDAFCGIIDEGDFLSPAGNGSTGRTWHSVHTGCFTAQIKEYPNLSFMVSLRKVVKIYFE